MALLACVGTRGIHGLLADRFGASIIAPAAKYGVLYTGGILQ